MQILIQTDGVVRCLYDEMLDLHGIGRLQIKRGSYVEPDQQGNWSTDLSPVAGPLLGPYRNRSDALHAEREWLEMHWLTNSR
ncbi:hypothetical protein [Gimesia aquarii]|uniref:Uncharacterized protein n=1 Tax=Gimesia aquarii TaxID=2527964 RepID=A0A517WWM3_9PLAN|nr:hypothetical protein [Gimesia aquarii]QDU09628.1 hypothetical protein V202x_30040 [Gimesia aquarii]